jgi:hypothetical protein
MNAKRPASAPPPEIPSDDGSIRRALETIDEHFKRWLDAIKAFAAPVSLVDPVVAKAPPPDVPVAKSDVPGEAVPVARPARRGMVVYEEPKAPAVTETAASPNDNEDRALLSQLDPETAHAVHMLRRIRGSRARLKDLIDEVRAKNGGGTTGDSKKKNWWRIGSS